MHYSNQIEKFPFPSVLSLRLLVEYWEKSIAEGKFSAISKAISEGIANAPDLRGVATPEILEKHKELIELLISAAIPPAQTDQEMIAATVPFRFNAFYTTNLFARTIDFGGLEKTASVNIPGNNMAVGKTVHACLLILNKFYGVDVHFDKPILFTIRNPKSGLDRIYKIEIGRQFFDVIALKKPEHIDPQIIKFLTEKIYDVDLWLQYIKPENFEFNGFMLFRMVDVTEQEMISSIKYDLLEKNAVSKKEIFSRIQHKLRSIFSMPDIRLGLAFFDHNNNIVLNSSEAECWNTLAADHYSGVPCDNYNGSVYERSWMEKKHVTIEDLEAFPFKTKVEEVLLENGIKNILLAPLVDDGETIGLLELASSTPGKLNPISAAKVENTLPMFTAAVKRVKEEMATEVRAIIQEECTNIHPAVQWRFLEAGLNLLNRRRYDEKAILEEIAFRDVYPMFGLADVRNSSVERNLAIQHDLIENLKMAKTLLHKIHQAIAMPAIEELVFKCENLIATIREGLASGDENNVLEFLSTELNPLFRHFEEDPRLRDAVLDYKSELDPRAGVVYKKRKVFEEGLGQINKLISNYLDEAQETAQQMFPHYFEKYQTDGVEHTLYLGSSIARDRKFDSFYLKNFRLWQLLLMCEIDARMEKLKPELKIKLELTQLILVHDQPLTIRFRPDEKQFDVDGAYDVRYEIVKKRIDKAFIRNTKERLTQPGKIAIVYNQNKIEEEYRQYFEFLASKNIISPEIEKVDLEELPGATGLKALRITVLRTPRSSVEENQLLKNITATLSLQ